MADKSLAIAVALVVIAFGILAAIVLSLGFLDNRVVAWGSLTLPAEDSTLTTLLSGSSTSTLGNYDGLTLEGTAFTAPAEFVIAGWIVKAATSTEVIVTLGHSTAFPIDSAIAPAAAVTLFELTLPADGAPVDTRLYLPVPTGRYIWVRISGAAGTWPARAVVLGATSP